MATGAELKASTILHATVTLIWWVLRVATKHWQQRRTARRCRTTEPVNGIDPGLTLLTTAAGKGVAAVAEQRPNVLRITSEDMSPHPG